MTNANWKLPLLNNYIEKWASERPNQDAMIQAEDGRKMSYQEVSSLIDVYALRLLDMGIKKGDRVATMLLTTPEHLVLMYACFKIGAIVAPIDLRLKENEVVRDLNKIDTQAFFFLGNSPQRDFRKVGQSVYKHCESVEHLIQVPLSEDEQLVEGATSLVDLFNQDKIASIKEDTKLLQSLKDVYQSLDTRTPVLIIYTTGTTGEPKPALLCHENIIVQNEILARGINIRENFRFIVNLPPSHVAGTSEGPMTTFFVGGTAIMLRIFDPTLTLKAIEDYDATIIGMIPTQYRFLWNLPNYEDFDLSSLKFAIYAGAPGDRPFLKKLSEMAPCFGTGLGMTENAGFATITPEGISIEEMEGQVGRYFDDLAEVSIRKQMNEDGSAGAEVALGDVGEICYHPPIVFCGYYNQPEKTKEAVSKEGILYTGDLGYFKDLGEYKALYLSGRRKFIIKQKGYNVFPDEIEAFISSHPKVAQTQVVGVKHELYDEGIFAFVQARPNESVEMEELEDHCRRIAAYKRPQHIEVISSEDSFPLTRLGKVDKISLQHSAKQIVERLQEEKYWDQA